MNCRGIEPGCSARGTRRVGEWLRAALKAKGMSQRQLAQRSGVDHSTIARIVVGVGAPSLETAIKLATGLGERYSALVGPGHRDIEATAASDPITAEITAIMRDRAAAARDEAAALRDERAGLEEARIVSSDKSSARKLEELQAQAGADRAQAALDRRRAASDRAKGGG